MSTKQWLAVAAWVFMPLAASAQQKQPEPNPLDPNAPVSAPAYESAFQTSRSSLDDDETPDQVWRAANDEMTGLGGHVGHMKESASQAVPPANAEHTAPEQGDAADHSKHH